MRELFAQARKKTPSIVFIDELDAVGGRRGTSFNDERDQTLNQVRGKGGRTRGERKREDRDETNHSPRSPSLLIAAFDGDGRIR